jgi:hypothetical protein
MRTRFRRALPIHVDNSVHHHPCPSRESFLPLDPPDNEAVRVAALPRPIRHVPCSSHMPAPLFLLHPSGCSGSLFHLTLPSWLSGIKLVALMISTIARPVMTRTVSTPSLYKIHHATSIQSLRAAKVHRPFRWLMQGRFVGSYLCRQLCRQRYATTRNHHHHETPNRPSTAR